MQLLVQLTVRKGYKNVELAPEVCETLGLLLKPDVPRENGCSVYQSAYVDPNNHSSHIQCIRRARHAGGADYPLEIECVGRPSISDRAGRHAGGRGHRINARREMLFVVRCPDYCSQRLEWSC
jgi:hypothetical protein